MRSRSSGSSATSGILDRSFPTPCGAAFQRRRPPSVAHSWLPNSVSSSAAYSAFPAFSAASSERDTLSNVSNIVVASVLHAPPPSILLLVDPEYLDRMSWKEVKRTGVTPLAPDAPPAGFMQLRSAVWAVAWDVDDATAEDSPVSRSDTIAHSSHVT